MLSAGMPHRPPEPPKLSGEIMSIRLLDFFTL